ncbi:MAG: hypothetical protein KQ78_02251 [Candidatus Izimaplasma bacterium HR2]|nr:MAG: hypothetical protein KQ78_02251 [Candidatus Izimaplasma bacterium HR2]
MNDYEATYKVVHPNWNQSLPDIFDTFEDAFEAQQKWDKTATIEQINGDSVNVIWEPYYETFVTNIYFR